MKAAVHFPFDNLRLGPWVSWWQRIFLAFLPTRVFSATNDETVRCTLFVKYWRGTYYIIDERIEYPIC